MALPSFSEIDHMDLSIFPEIDYDGGFYSIRDVIKRLSNLFDISFKGKSGKSMRKNIYTRLWRELEAMKPIAPEDVRKVSQRRTEYSFCIWNRIFRKIYPWLCENSGNPEHQKIKIFEEFAKKNNQNEDEIMDRYDKAIKEALPYSDLERYVDNEVRRRKLEIALDYIFTHLIELDEKQLRLDIARGYVFDEFNCTALDVMINERCSNNKYYYTIRNGNINKENS